MLMTEYGDWPLHLIQIGELFSWFVETNQVEVKHDSTAN